ncbi:hypothetical protein MCEKE4_00292 [Acidimicrobiia bacterium]
MAKTLVGVMAVSIAALLFAGCGNTDSAVPEATTTTTAAKTVVSSYCGDRAAAVKAGVMSQQEFSESNTRALLDGDSIGVITMIWSDGSMSPTKELCILKDGPSLSERGDIPDFSKLPKKW